MLIRTIIYMNCHPRIAVLYGTITAAADDLFHFFILFTVIYSVFGFAAHWAIGADNEKYQTFPAALTTQFEMVIGEFPWQDDVGGLESREDACRQWLHGHQCRSGAWKREKVSRVHLQS